MLKHKPAFGFAKCYLAILGIFSSFALTIKWISSFIFAGEELQIIINPQGEWRFLSATEL